MKAILAIYMYANTTVYHFFQYTTHIILMDQLSYIKVSYHALTQKAFLMFPFTTGFLILPTFILSFREGKIATQNHQNIIRLMNDISNVEKISSWIIHSKVSVSK